MVVVGSSGPSLTALVAPSSAPIRALRACLAGLGLVSMDGVRDLSARCLSCSAAAAVMGAGLGRGLLPGLGEGSLEDSRRLEERFGGLDGLAKVADEEPPPTVGDAVEVSLEDSDGFDDDSAIKGLCSKLRDGRCRCLGNMGRNEGTAEATRYVDILAQYFGSYLVMRNIGLIQ
jgi:hypothetical protein